MRSSLKDKGHGAKQTRKQLERVLTGLSRAFSSYCSELSSFYVHILNSY